MENVTPEITEAPAKKIRGVHYVGQIGSYSVYHYFKGNRPIFEIAVDNEDPTLKIRVGKVGDAQLTIDQGIQWLYETKGHAQYKTDKNGTRVSGYSVRSYIRPRAFSIFANIFVPGSINDEHDGDDTTED